MFEYAIKTLEANIRLLDVQKNYWNLNYSKAEKYYQREINKIAELQQAIEVLKKAGKK